MERQTVIEQKKKSADVEETIASGTDGLMMMFTAKDGTIVTLRPAREDDAEDIVREVQFIVEEGAYIQKDVSRTVEEERAFIQKQHELGNMYTVVEFSGRVHGLARVMRGDIKMKRHIGGFRIWLGKQAQGKGIGKKMMEYTLQWGRLQPDLYKIWLGVFSSNENAFHLYRKFGFEVEGIMKGQAHINGELQDEIFMSLFLKN